MRRIRLAILISLCSFVLGVAVGSLTVAPYEGRGHNQPVPVDFCFLILNPELIGSRRFITEAQITPNSPHATMLESASCPELASGFVEQLDRKDLASELERRFHADPYSPVPVEFEGTMYRPSLVRRMWYAVAANFGMHGYSTPPITIRAYRAIGDSKAQFSPSSAPDAFSKP
jgi:hypothetical protein